MTTNTKKINLPTQDDVDEMQFIEVGHQDEEHITDLGVLNEFMARFSVKYFPRFTDEKGNYAYNPRVNSEYRRGEYLNGYYVSYSFPKGGKSPVASVWTKYTDERNKERFAYYHISFSSVMEHLLEYYEKSGYLPPNPEMDPNYGLEEEVNEADDGTF